ncbi:MAG: hypothetical protein Kow0074_07760 [Candidatus Zixiibacteriota bacterium]
MRVTHQMITDQTTANLSRSIARLLALQTEMSSGRRLRRPSDDPVGVTRDLSYRTTIKTVAQYQGNISSATTQLNTIEQSLGSMSDLLLRARELATSLADDVYDATARAGAAEEARDLFEQMLQAGNVQSEGRYLLSGHLTRNQAFRATPGGVVYQGDTGVVYSQIESSSKVPINLIGSEVLLKSIYTLGDGFDLNRGISGTVPLADLHQGAAVDQAPGIIQFTDVNANLTVAVDLSGASTIDDVITGVANQLAAGGMTGVADEVSPAGNALRVVIADDPTVVGTTRLENLNGGAGVDMVQGRFRITTDSGVPNLTVDVSGASTIDDVITAVNTQLAGAGINNVTLDIDPSGTALRLRDTNAVPLGLRIDDFDGGTTAQDLGLRGYVNDELVGNDLAPRKVVTIAENAAGESTAADLGILGTFRQTADGTDLDPILTLTTPVAELKNSIGLSLGTIRLTQGDRFALVDLSSAVTVSDIIAGINNSGLEVQASLNSDQTGIQVIATASDKSLTIVDEDASGTAAVLGIKGSPDLLGNMLLLIDALENDDQAMISEMIGAFEKGTNHILDQRASVGANIRRMDSTSARLTDFSLSVTRLLSEIEDADIIKVTTELATQQNVYQAALNATARVLTPSLVDFIR